MTEITSKLLTVEVTGSIWRFHGVVVCLIMLWGPCAACYEGQLKLLQKDAPDPAGVISKTACDTDQHCRKVLCSLRKDLILLKFWLYWIRFDYLISDNPISMNLSLACLVLSSGLSTTTRQCRVGRSCLLNGSF